MEVIYTPRFARVYKKLPEEIKDLAEKQEATFRCNPFDPQLKTHQLKGRLKNLFSFSIGYKYRIIFEFSKDKKTVYFLTVGNHDVYK